MIVSFHPLFKGDMNILCAGRDPGPGDLSAIRSAAAVILPQGCTRPLFEMAQRNCGRVFPNYDARFRYPGKTGQIRLFRETGTNHPATALFAGVADYPDRHGEGPSPGLPCVFKFDWGGEGDTVFLVRSPEELSVVFFDTRLYGWLPIPSGLLPEYLRRGLDLPFITGRAAYYVFVAPFRGRRQHPLEGIRGKQDEGQQADGNQSQHRQHARHHDLGQLARRQRHRLA